MKIEETRLNFNVPTSFKNEVMAEAKKIGVPMSAYIIFAIKEYMKQSSITDIALMFKELEKKMEVLEND